MKLKKIALAISLTLILTILFPVANALAANVQVQTQQANTKTNAVALTLNQNRPLSTRMIIIRNPVILPIGNTPVPITQSMPQPTPQSVVQPTPPLSGSQVHQLSESELLMINLVNQERQKAGVAPLRIDNALSRVARLKSEDMMTNEYFSHTSPTYGSPFQMMRTFGISFRSAGENIARSSSVTNAHNRLMNSEGHRRNILNPNFTHIGIGIAGGRYHTQMFISR